MKVIGLTGGIASGKSTVSELLRGYGFAVVDADVASRTAVAAGSDGLQEVIAVFGGEAVIDGEMNRPYIGQLVFNDPEKRAALNSIIHPRVREIMALEKRAALQNGRHVVMDIPLLYENKLEATVDEAWVVYVPEHLQLERLMKRNDMTQEAAAARIASQLAIEEKKARADVVIDNSGDLQTLEQHVKKAVEQFFERNEKK
ncbi:dephospho-CoA kinase [Macrococcus equipercicus]|uniref:Dephospho-CoA kinase n=1 Tax=Macrococcus equipercicus TaxID=69967 RepID=A0A9Q9BVG5_9STAP|nr:dephospho-CoA kinase [Macrococcus equipercicus]UTH14901.1 dephospho-CoA kinase [Macrococcus equipercicus]